MKFYYFYIPSNLAKVGAVYLLYFIIMALYVLLILINFRFRVNRTKKQSKNDSKPLVYLIPSHIDHVQKYIDPVEYIALKSMIFNENEGHFMRVYKEYSMNNGRDAKSTYSAKRRSKSLRKKGNYWNDENSRNRANVDKNETKMGDSRFIRSSKLAKNLKIDLKESKTIKEEMINTQLDPTGAISDRQGEKKNPMHNSKFYGQSYKNLKRNQYQY